jgi:hypothetical protein
MNVAGGHGVWAASMSADSEECSVIELRQEDATDGVREASQSHAFDSPMPAEHMDV